MVALSMPLPAAAAPARPPRRASAGRRVRRIGLRADAISEVAMRCARHDGLCSFEGDAGIEPLAERAVAIARQQVADLAEAHVPVHLGIAAARDVEIEPLARTARSEETRLNSSH